MLRSLERGSIGRRIAKYTNAPTVRSWVLGLPTLDSGGRLLWQFDAMHAYRWDMDPDELVISLVGMLAEQGFSVEKRRVQDVHRIPIASQAASFLDHKTAKKLEEEFHYRDYIKDNYLTIDVSHHICPDMIVARK